jgi:hypothetical protein
MPDSEGLCFRRAAVDEVAGLVGEHVGRVTGKRGGLGGSLRSGLVGYIGTVCILQDEPLVPARRHVEAAVAIHVFAHVLGLVSNLVEPGGYCGLIKTQISELALSTVRRGVVEYVVVVGILAPYDGGPRRAAQGVGDVGVLEGGAVRTHSLPYAAELLPRPFVEVAGHGEHEVRALCALGPSPLVPRKEPITRPP